MPLQTEWRFAIDPFSEFKLFAVAVVSNPDIEEQGWDLMGPAAWFEFCCLEIDKLALVNHDSLIMNYNLFMQKE